MIPITAFPFDPDFVDPLLLADFYKFDHVHQYQPGTTRVVVNWTPRSSRIKDQKHVVFFGLQYFIKKYLIHTWNKYFFQQPWESIEARHREFVISTLGACNNISHIKALWDLGYLPLDIYALPEGTLTPLGCPMLVIVNTEDSAFWLPNFIESILSNILWKPCTSATTALRFRKKFVHWAIKSGEEDLSFVDWQGHDFSMRGMGGLEDAILSGMGHLLCFSGTDTAPAIQAAHDYYGAPLNCGGSVYATEHSVMCAGLQTGEKETIRRLIEDLYPLGVVSIVSDTWDIWTLLTSYVPELRDKILARDGKTVFRPDSGIPEDIMCGNRAYDYVKGSGYWKGAPSMPHPASLGVLQLLALALGVDDQRAGLPLIKKAGTIYGDGINEERAETILFRTVNELKLSSYNVVLGLGSFTYVYTTRDTYGFAMKATAAKQNGVWYDLFKKPVTDDGGKFSHKGIPIVELADPDVLSSPLTVRQQGTLQDLDNCCMLKVFSDSALLIDQKFDDIKKRVRAWSTPSVTQKIAA